MLVTYFISSMLLSSATKLIRESKRPITLITFDVDGTLIHGVSTTSEATIHSKAFMYATGKIYGNENNWHLKISSPPLVIPSEKYHGCTDGLISLNIAKYAFNIPPTQSFNLLPDVFQEMINFVNQHSDEDISRSNEPLPLVIETLTKIANDPVYKQSVLCGLVTGNVEEIARKKMKATGITQTNIFSPPALDQLTNAEQCQQSGSELELDPPGFLGGFGSDFCSGDIEDQTRIYKDRGEQILIAMNRAMQFIDEKTQYLARVVHVGDAPADVLALKYCYEKLNNNNNNNNNNLNANDSNSTSNIKDKNINKIKNNNNNNNNIQVTNLNTIPVMSIIAVATGKFTSEILETYAGEAVIGYEPYVLSQGIADPRFISLLGIHK